MECKKCHIEFEGEHMTTARGNIICPSCYEEHYFTCDDCGRIFRNDRLDDHHMGICKNCFDDNFFICNDCGKVCRMNDHTGNSICDDCESDYSTCHKCGGRYHIDEMYNDIVCDNCYDNSNTLLESRYTPDPLIFNKIDEVTNEFFGLEIEVETDNISLAETISRDPHFYCKEDCSVSGFEIVTHPMTRKWFYDALEGGRFDKIFNLSKSGCKSYYADCSCGLHIHMSKNSFSKLTIYKMFRLIYGEAYAEFWTRISRRKTLGEFASIDKSIHKASTYAKNGLGYGKFSGLNITEHTCELRIFRGTLNKESFIGNVELYFAFKDYAKSSSISEISIENMMKFIMANKKTYPMLIKLLDKVYPNQEYKSVGFVGSKFDDGERVRIC